MQKQKKIDWKDTNMALFGSDIEKKVKQAAADGEPQWDDAGLRVGLQIWRIEQFKVVQWPKSKYGKFHKGDSYIILNTYVQDPQINPDKLAWDVHFWIGDESSQDEYGTAAYKTVELDDKLRGAPVQHREVQGHESQLFLSYFPGNHVTFLDGGVASGFNHVQAGSGVAGDMGAHSEVILLQVKGRRDNIALTQVELSRSSMNSGDVFILVTPEAIYQWNGSSSNGQERSKAAQFCLSLRNDRGSVSVVTMTEGQDDEEAGSGAPFWAHLPGARKVMGITVASITVKTSEKGGDDANVKMPTPTLYRLGAARGSVSVVARFPAGKTNKPSVSKLKSDGVFFVDDGFRVMVWQGRQAPTSLKAGAFPAVQAYLRSYKRPPVLPVTKYSEGNEPNEFKALFGPPKEDSCCVIA